MDAVDALTMVPGIVGAHWFAWRSDDFVYKVSVLSWVWTCACSMIYHFNGSPRELRRSDLTSQWVSQAFMTLSTPQPSWPILIGGFAPVRRTGRAVLNGLGGYYFMWHYRKALTWLTSSYLLYVGQYVLKQPWMHGAFHLCLHAAGACVASDPVTKWRVPIPGALAYVVEVVGLVALLPRRTLSTAIRSLASLLGRRQSDKSRALSGSEKPGETCGPAPSPTTTAGAGSGSEATSS